MTDKKAEEKETKYPIDPSTAWTSRKSKEFQEPAFKEVTEDELRKGLKK